MPHIIFEYSHAAVREGSVPHLLKELHETLAAEESVDIRRLKSRAYALHDVVVGDMGPLGSMAHVTVKLMATQSSCLKPFPSVTVSVQCAKCLPNGAQAGVAAHSSLKAGATCSPNSFAHQFPRHTPETI